jgi:hypothetical protein
LDQERRVPEDFNENGGGMPQERPLGQPRKRDTRPDEQRYRYRRETNNTVLSKPRRSSGNPNVTTEMSIDIRGFTPTTGANFVAECDQ